jgi:hypothetical protein
MKRVNIRKFNRELYRLIPDIPFEVVNTRTNEILFLVIKPRRKKCQK